MRRLLRCFGWVWVGVLFALTPWLGDGLGGAWATPGMYPGQTGYPSQGSYQEPVVLIGLSATPGKHGETRLELDFSGPAPTYTLLSSDPAKPALAFAQTTRGTSATFAARSSGLLQGADFDQKTSALALNFTVSGPAQIKV